jgi:hypothetical protein
VVAAEVETVEDCLPTDKVDQGLDSGGDGNDGRQIPAIAPMANEDHEIKPGLVMIPSVHNSVKATEDQATLGPSMSGPTTMGCAIDPQVSKLISAADSDEDAEAEIDVDAVENPALASPTNG